MTDSAEEILLSGAWSCQESFLDSWITPHVVKPFIKPSRFFFVFFFDTFLRSLGKISIVLGGIYMVSVGVYLRTDSDREIFIVRNFDVSRVPKETREIKRVSLTADFPCCKTRCAHTSHMKSRFMSYFFDSWYCCNTVSLTRSNIKYGLLWVLNVIL